MNSGRHGGLESDAGQTHDRHMGDLGNIFFEQDVPQPIFQSQLTIYGPEYNILGRALVIHRDRDDEGLEDNAESRLTGNSGPRIACGIIVSTAPFPDPTPTPTAKH